LKSAVGNTNLCISHGGGRRCILSICSKSARGGSNYCRSHGVAERARFAKLTKEEIKKCLIEEARAFKEAEEALQGNDRGRAKKRGMEGITQPEMLATLVMNKGENPHGHKRSKTSIQDEANMKKAIAEMDNSIGYDPKGLNTDKRNAAATIAAGLVSTSPIASTASLLEQRKEHPDQFHQQSKFAREMGSLLTNMVQTGGQGSPTHHHHVNSPTSGGSPMGRATRASRRH